MIQAFKATGTKPTERLVSYMLADHHNDGTGRCDPSISLLAEETGLDERSVIRAIQRLEESGHLTVCRRAGARSSYDLHPVAADPPLSQSHPRQRVTPPLSQSHPCHSVTTDTESPQPLSESQGHPCHSVTPPLSQSHPNHNKPEENRNGTVSEPELVLSDSKKPASAKAKAASPGEAEEFALSLGATAGQGEAWFWKMEGQGWINGKKPIKDWKATVRSHFFQGYLPIADPSRPVVVRQPQPVSDTPEVSRSYEDDLRARGASDEDIERRRRLLARFAPTIQTLTGATA